MSKIEKIKRVFLIVLGLSLSAYLMFNGLAILDQENAKEESKNKSVEIK